MMHYLGIDIAKTTHHCALLAGDGTSVSKQFTIGNSLDGFTQLVTLFGELHLTPDTVLIGFEATGNLWENLYSFLTERKFKVIVLNPYQTCKFHQALMKKAKTDKIDAGTIAELLRTNKYAASFIPEDAVQSLRELTRFRYNIITDRKNYQRRALAELRLIFPEYQSTLLKHPFSKASLSILTKYSTAEHLKKVTVKQIRHRIKSLKNVIISDADIQRLIATAQRSCYSGKAKDARATTLQITLSQIQMFTDAIDHLENEIAEILNPGGEAKTFTGSNVLAVPGMGMVTLATVIGAAGFHGEAFATGTRYLGHIGFFPRINESGDSRRTPTLARKGPRYLRWTHYMIGVAASKYNAPMNQFYHDKVSQGKSPKEALICVSKKMAFLILSMLKSGEAYHPERISVQNHRPPSKNMA